ncbi:MAG: glutamate synthase subunit beta [Spartobacteria bacterium]|nr:glutamate synthase subunit beta [Spartobacteria bacterium]
MASKNDKNIERRDPGYRRKSERLEDYREVEQMLSEGEVVIQASRCMSCGTPFCHGYACPLTNIVPETNELVMDGRWEDALKLLLSTHPFPEFTARICPALCEGSCVKGINDQPVTIRQIEKMIIEKGFENGWVKPQPPKHRRSEHIAVIGSGPAGLAAAERLNKKGFMVTVFEKDLSAGGLMRYGIPNFKLDKTIVDRRINLMKQEGIRFECGVNVGKDISFNYLKTRFAAIVMTGGTQLPRDLKVPGRELKGVYYAMHFLSAQNKRLMDEPLTPEQDVSATGKNVVIIGGGDTGSDCLGTSLRQGAKQVYQLEIMPRAPEDRSEDNPWPLWPRIDRVSSSHKEGGIRRWCVNTKSLEGDEDGQVRKLHGIEIEWVEKDGRMTPVDKPGTEFTIDADLVLLSMGFLGPGPDPLAEELGLERDARSNIKVDAQHMTSMPGVFSAGDMARGQSLVVRAMADGKAAADDVISFINAGRTI